MKIQTSSLVRLQLNWAVAKCESDEMVDTTEDGLVRVGVKTPSGFEMWEPSTNWAQGGPIIERERITVDSVVGISYKRWRATNWSNGWVYGDTPLIAAMRCYVASQLGDEVDIPEELA